MHIWDSGCSAQALLKGLLHLSATDGRCYCFFFTQEVTNWGLKAISLTGGKSGEWPTFCRKAAVLCQVIYVGHLCQSLCSRSVQWQSSLICLNSLTQRLALITLWQHTYIVHCIPKKLIKELGQMADDMDRAITSVRLLISSLLSFLPL